MVGEAENARKTNENWALLGGSGVEGGIAGRRAACRGDGGWLAARQRGAEAVHAQSGLRARDRGGVTDPTDAVIQLVAQRIGPVG
ncbi:hypothetical protein [Kibdelosporangium philippinense]|uniref:hypothetical protein n=1 Tax=Kibdelosporangium philippinense TaxID=211113 RepID=UPI00362180DE